MASQALRTRLMMDLLDLESGRAKSKANRFLLDHHVDPTLNQLVCHQQNSLTSSLMSPIRLIGANEIPQTVGDGAGCAWSSAMEMRSSRMLVNLVAARLMCG